MKYKNVTVEESTNEQNSIYKISIPEKILDESFEFEPYKLLTLKVGLSEYKVLPSVNDSSERIELPQALMEEIGLYSGYSCNAYLKRGVLSLGPVVAIFVSKIMIRKAKKQVFSPNGYEYLNANKIAKCILYFFCVDDVDLINHKVDGTIYNQKNSCFEKRSFPLPNILYDRGGSRYNLANVSNYIRSQFEKTNKMRKINAQSYFDKLDLYHVITENKDLNVHQPFTTSYSEENLLDLFTENKTLYVKARLGSNGRSVMKIEKQSDLSYKCSTARDNVICTTVNTVDEVNREIKDFFQNRELLIQSEIELFKIDDCIVDMRATVQRDANGVLGITVYVVRVAQKDSPVTSTASGSNVYSFDEFFKSKSNYSQEQLVSLKSEVDDFLIKVYKHIENHYGSFGEMGIDFGIDNYGKIWFIESNSKPAKSTIHLLGDYKILQRSYLYPLEYAKYLAALNL